MVPRDAAYSSLVLSLVYRIIQGGMKSNPQNIPPAGPVHRIGAIRFFNTRPLVYSLDENPAVRVEYDIPSALAEGMDAGRYDVSLTPSIDYQAPHRQWVMVPAGGICSWGAVLTVRIFSREPLDRMVRIAGDRDSHTSIALARILWKLRYGRELDMVPLEGAISSAPAVLLIGDKVISQLPRWEHQLDLGAAWTEATGLPFVWAFWSMPEDRAARPLYDILHGARLAGERNLPQIIRRHAEAHGFPEDVAKRYFQENIHFELTGAHLQGLAAFYQLAHEMGITCANRPLRAAGAAAERAAI